MAHNVFPRTPLQFYHFLALCVYPFKRMLPHGLTTDEKRKRLMAIAGALMGFPILCYFVVVDVFDRETIGVFLDGGLAVILLGGVVVLSRVKQGIWVYRAFVVGLTILCCYNSFCGPSGESSLMWLLIYPPVVFFIIGLPEGLYWFVGIFIINVCSIQFPQMLGTSFYNENMRIRFILVWVIIAFFSLAFELLRWYFYSLLEKRGEELSDALENIKTLRGLLPICSVCKRIRDDEGYWNVLEEYLSKHTDAVMTHGICNSCIQTKYPEIFKKRMAAKKE